MLILGIVGSPRKDGRTAALVQAALEGAAASGAETRNIFLFDYAIRPFSAAGGSGEGVRFCPLELSLLCEQADAIVLGAPVYWGDINGMTKDFMDSVRIANSNGKPGLGIAIAGGSGKGLLSGVQSIYHFYYHKQMRGVDPTPVSRFNMEEALVGLKASGARLVEMARQPMPFPGATADERWPDVVAHYATLPYLDGDPVAEFLMLAEQLVGASSSDKLEAARAELAQAHHALLRHDRPAAGRHAVRCYLLLYYPG